jgi:hypothetical protein
MQFWTKLKNTLNSLCPQPRLHSTLPLRLTKIPAVTEVSTFVYCTYYDDKDEIIPAISLQVCLHPDLNLSNDKNRIIVRVNWTPIGIENL